MMKKVICILVAVLGLVCVAQAANVWTAYDSFSGISLDEGRWERIPTDGSWGQCAVSSGKLKFDVNYPGRKSWSGIFVKESNVNGIRAILRLDSASTTEDGGIEIMVVGGERDHDNEYLYEYSTYIELSYADSSDPDESWADINAVFSWWGMEQYPYCATEELELDRDYELSIIAGDDDRFYYYLDGKSFGESDVYPGLKDEIVSYGLGIWSDLDGSVKAYADDVKVFKEESASVYDLSGE